MQGKRKRVARARPRRHEVGGDERERREEKGERRGEDASLSSSPLSRQDEGEGEGRERSVVLVVVGFMSHVASARCCGGGHHCVTVALTSRGEDEGERKSASGLRCHRRRCVTEVMMQL